MKKGNLFFAAFCAVLGVVIIAAAMGYPTAEDYGTGVPGPGLWPITVSAVMLLCAAAIAIKALRAAPDGLPGLSMWTPGARRVYLTMAVLFCYLLALEPLGFILSTAAMQFLFIQWFAKKKPWVTAVISIGMTMAVYFAFKSALNVPIDSFGIFVI